MPRTQTPTFRREVELDNLDVEDRALVMRRIGDLRGQVEHFRGHVKTLAGLVACPNPLLELDAIESELKDLEAATARALTNVCLVRRAS